MLCEESKGKVSTRRWLLRALAVSESHTTAAVSFRPRFQPGLEVSRSRRQSGWNPAEINIVLAFLTNGGQPEAIPINTEGTTGRYAASDSRAERRCSVRTSPLRDPRVFSFLLEADSTTGIAPGKVAEAISESVLTGRDKVAVISLTTICASCPSGSISRKWSGG